MKANPRALAARALVQVLEQGRSLATVLPATLAGVDDRRDAALVQELCYGTLRWYYRLAALLDLLLERPLKKSDAELRCLLLAGLYQLDAMALPQRVAVHETVQAVRTLNRQWASGLVNAVLRNFQRHGSDLDARLEGNDVARYAHPAWLIGRLQTDWPQDWRRVLDANNERPPFCVRVNRLRLTRAEYREILAEQGLAAAPLATTTHGLVLAQPVAVDVLPGFARGDVSVQDGAAQLAAALLDLRPGLRVLDACAAPGGKTAHLLELEPALDLTALDISAVRLQRVDENLQRLGLQARLLQGDAGTPAAWWDGQRYDRILLDAPCSGTGVIRRHPDIKVLRRAQDVDGLVQQQAQLLAAAWNMLAPGGLLLYCTCSILAAENNSQAGAFVSLRESAEAVPIPRDRGVTSGPGRQLLPGTSGMDGFYFACIRKRS